VSQDDRVITCFLGGRISLELGLSGGQGSSSPSPLLDKALVKELGHLGKISKYFSSFCDHHLPCHLLLLPGPPGQITAWMEQQGQQP